MAGKSPCLDVSESVQAILVQGLVNEDILLRGLHKVLATLSDLADEGKDVDTTLGVYFLHHGVQGDVGACAANAGAAVHNDRALVVGVAGVDVADQVQDAHGVSTGRVLVRPLWVVVLRDGERSSLRVLAQAGRGQDKAIFEWDTALGGGVNEVEGALDVVAAFLLVFQRDLEVAVLLGGVELVWPVLAAALHAFFYEFCEHDYGGDSVLADHAPEVDDCLALGPLGGDEFVVV